MPRSTRRPVAVLLAAGAVAAAACNVFVTVSKCDSDSDCPSGATCDPDGKFCIKTVVEAAPPPPPPIDASDADTSTPDADAAPPTCDPSTPFTTFKIVDGLEKTAVIGARLTPDETTVLYSALDGCTDATCYNLFAADRKDLTSPFGSGQPLLPLNCGQGSNYHPSMSADGTLIFFESSRPLGATDGGFCGSDQARIWLSTRQAGADFGPPHVDTRFQTSPDIVDGVPFLHPKGQSMYFSSIGRSATPGQFLYVATLGSLGLVATINQVAMTQTGKENFPVISLDETTLYFGRDEVPGIGFDIWMAHRANASAPFDAPVRLTEFSDKDDNLPSWISNDQCRLYYASNRDATDGGLSDFRLWVAERSPK